MSEEFLQLLKENPQFWQEFQHDVTVTARRAVMQTLERGMKNKLRAEIASGKIENQMLRVGMEMRGLTPADFTPPSNKSGKVLENRMFVTLQSRNDVDVDPLLFWNQMLKLYKKMALQGKGCFTLEQRSEGDDKPHGWHIHWDLTLDRPLHMSVFFQQISQNMAKYMLFPRKPDGKIDYSNIDIKVYEPSRHDGYIRGDKMKLKKPKVEKDIRLRDALGIPHIFEY